MKENFIKVWQPCLLPSVISKIVPKDQNHLDQISKTFFQMAPIKETKQSNKTTKKLPLKKHLRLFFSLHLPLKL